MNTAAYYDIFIYIVNLGVDFNSIFMLLDEDIQQEIFKYIEFLKTKPSKRDFVNYSISEDAFESFAEGVNYLLKKVFKK